jgi:hypothetical protein
MSFVRRKISLPVGHRTGKLTVIRGPEFVGGCLRVFCRCDCGVEKEVRQHNLTRAKPIVSCGCHRASFRLKHGHARGNSRRGRLYGAEYQIWLGMKDRCRNPNNQKYSRYGGRGITVCARWDDFAVFLADMGPRPSSKHSLDRHPDNGGPYAPDNCRWATLTQQQRNMRTNRHIEIEGTTRTTAEWAEVVGISASTISSRLHYGWSPADAVLTPVGFAYRRPTTC